VAWWFLQSANPNRLVGGCDGVGWHRERSCCARACSVGQRSQRRCELSWSIPGSFIIATLLTLFPNDRPFKSNTHSDPKLATIHIIFPWLERSSTGRCQSYCQKYATRSSKHSRIIFLLQKVLVLVLVDTTLYSYLDLDWVSIKALDTSMKVISRSMNRILVGLPLCMLFFL